jgi:5-methylthioadenosine/S-adenosylhomocysteine deaminase
MAARDMGWYLLASGFRRWNTASPPSAPCSCCARAAPSVGRAADMVLIDWREISYPYLDAETPLLDAVLQRAKTSGVRTVICDGDVIYHDAKFTRVDRDGALRALHEDLQRALSDDEVERRRLSKSLLPHVRAFYANYFDPEQHAPFYRQSSRQ